MKSAREKIEELTNKLNKWAKEYYENDQPIVSDAQYDGAYWELLELEKQNPKLARNDSPTKRVGGKVDSRFNKIKHNFPMLSLGNAFNDDDLIKFDKQIKDLLHLKKEIFYTIEYKIDGLSISLKYENGILKQAITRGDGLVGEDVTHNANEIKSIPKKIDYKKPLEIRGEVFMPEKIFSKLLSAGSKLANQRNAAAGSLRQKNPSIARQRELDAFLYQIPNPLSHNLFSQNDCLIFLKKLGFHVNEKTTKVEGIKNVILKVKSMFEKRKDLGYDVDGIVIKVDNINLYEDIGYTVKFPKFMIAYKFPEEIVTTELKAIFPTVGRTGRITYNAKLSPVRISGSLVSAATLHNADYIKSINVEAGDIVKVKKAGEIIPKVLGPLEKKNQKTKWLEITHCPSCKKELTRFKDEVDQYCINDKCPAQSKARIEHFVSREAMNIEGISSKIIDTLIKNNFIKNISSLYELNKYEEKLIQIPRLHKKSVKNILNSIEKSKNQDLNKFLFGLGIRHLGAKNSKIIAKRFGNLASIINASKEQLTNIRDLGPKVSNSIIEFFSNQKNIDLIKKIIDLGLLLKEFKPQESTLLNGMNFVITGTLSQTRNHFKDIIENNGGNVASAVSKNTTFLLAGENAGSKRTKAESLNVKILNEEDFLNLLKGENNERIR